MIFLPAEKQNFSKKSDFGKLKKADLCDLD